jgi:hypothetical protein
MLPGRQRDFRLNSWPPSKGGLGAQQSFRSGISDIGSTAPQLAVSCAARNSDRRDGTTRILGAHLCSPARKRGPPPAWSHQREFGHGPTHAGCHERAPAAVSAMTLDSEWSKTLTAREILDAQQATLDAYMDEQSGAPVHMGEGDVEIVLDAILGHTQPLVKRLANALDRIAELERRLVEIETKGVSYTGTFQRAIEYRRGALVTHDGSLWVALADMRAPCPEPGGGAPEWQLAVRKGRDAR